MTDDTSFSLLHRARRSPEDSGWRELCALYEPLLRRWLRRYDLVGADADDLVQEVLVVVTQELGRFEHNARVGAFRTWLRTVLVHRVKDHWRKRNHRPAAEGGTQFLQRIRELEDDASGVSRQWDREHDRHVVGRLLARIEPLFEPQTFEAFRRVVIDRDPPQVVARELGLSLNAVYIAKSRVLRELRREAEGLLDTD
jgi:RNA polymerase sigma-70 factor (ECF subfamily)